MFNIFKKKPATIGPTTADGLVLQMRETLFGDMPLNLFPPPDANLDDAWPMGMLTATREAVLAKRYSYHFPIMNLQILTACLALLGLTGYAKDSSKPLSLTEEHEQREKQTVAIKAAAAEFCSELRRERIEGLPTATELQRLSPFLTPELNDCLKRARILQDNQIPAQSDEKPDGIEGDLFSSLFEGVTSWELGVALNAPNTDPSVNVMQTYAEEGHKPVTWSDTLIFKRSKDRWLVNDILMGGKWEFKNGKTLRNRLPGGIKQAQDHDSPDGAWHVTFEREEGNLNRVVITDKKGATKPMTLYGDKPYQPCSFPSWLIWSPDCRMLAFRPGEGPRFTGTIVYRLADNKWVPVSIPQFYLKERKILTDNHFRERQCLNDAAYWQDTHTLVIHYFGLFTKEDEGDGFDKLISVRIDPKGKARIVEAVDAPADY